jgi:hypothetical protein
LNGGSCYLEGGLKAGEQLPPPLVGGVVTLGAVHVCVCVGADSEACLLGWLLGVEVVAWLIALFL